MGAGRVYRRGLATGPFDAIVVGSGIGGLATAALLARAGRRVLVLERHYVAGGFTHTFRRPGYEWDVGVHYVGEVHRTRSLLRSLFDDVSEGRLQWARMADVYDRIVVGDSAYDLVAERPASWRSWRATSPPSAGRSNATSPSSARPPAPRGLSSPSGRSHRGWAPSPARSWAAPSAATPHARP